MNNMVDLTDDGHDQGEPFAAADVIDLATSEDSDDEGQSLPPAPSDDKPKFIGVEISADVVDLLVDDGDDQSDDTTANAKNEGYASEKIDHATGEDSDDKGEFLPKVALDDKPKFIGVDSSADVVDLLADDGDDQSDDTTAYARNEGYASEKCDHATGEDSADKGESFTSAALEDKQKFIGVEISADVVDLLADEVEDNADDTTAYAENEEYASEKIDHATGEDSDDKGESLPKVALDDKPKFIGVEISADVVDLLAEDGDDQSDDTNAYAKNEGYASEKCDHATGEDSDDKSESLPKGALDDKPKFIGVEISADVVDLLADDGDDHSDDTTAYAKNEGYASEKCDHHATGEDSDDKGESLPLAALDDKPKVIGAEISADVVEIVADEEEDNADTTTAYAKTEGHASEKIDHAMGEDSDDKGESLPPAASDGMPKLIGVEISADVVDLLADNDDDQSDDTTAYAKTEGHASEQIDHLTNEDSDDKGESLPPAALDDKPKLIGVELSADVVDLLAEDGDDQLDDAAAYAETGCYASEKIDHATTEDEDDTTAYAETGGHASEKSDHATTEDSDDKRESLPPAAWDNTPKFIGVEISADVVDFIAVDEDDKADDTTAYAKNEGHASEQIDHAASEDNGDEGESLPKAALDDKARLIGVEISADVVDFIADDEDDNADGTTAYAKTEGYASEKIDHATSEDSDHKGESLPPAALDKPKLIGVEISADVADFLADDKDEKADEITAYAKTEGYASERQSVQQSHPRKYMPVKPSRKRRREKAMQKEADERAEAVQRRPKVADRFNPENIPGGCNFVVIDDDSSEDEVEFEMSVNEQRNNLGMPTNKKAAQSTVQPHKGVLREQSYLYQKKPFIKKLCPQNENSFHRDRDYDFTISQEDAFKMQERMLRDSAARVALLHLADQVKSSPLSEAIVAPIFDIAKRHPDHWRWKEPYACLGLPRNASMTLVKSQYRRLAKLYHPDKSKHADAANRFHGIAMAYRKLSQSD
jgi:DnaJ-domain-containing protein 1